MGFSPSFCCLLLLPFVLIHDAQQLRWILLIWATEGLAMLLHFLMWEHECTWQRIEKRLFGHGRKVESNHQLSLLLLPNDIRFYLQKKIETHCLKIVQKRVPLYVSWTNNRFLCAPPLSLGFACLMRQKRRSERATKVRDGLTNGFDRKSIYSLCFLSFALSVYSINQKWSFDDESTRARVRVFTGCLAQTWPYH